MKNNHLEITLNYFNVPEKQIDVNKVINVYVYGSVAYDTRTELSDMDYIIIYNQDIDISDTLITKIHDETLNATLISPGHFQKMLDEHKIDVIECFFMREDYKYETKKFNFNLDLFKLRTEISSISSNSWVKSKKKIIQNDNYIGKKSLFHSLRILDFGIQLAKNGKIVSYTKPQSKTLNYVSFSNLLNEIMEFNTWDELYNKYKKIYNNLKSEFKLLAPK